MKVHFIKLFVMLAFGISSGLHSFGQLPAKSKDGKYTLNLDKNGCMVQGYDVVAMFTQPDTSIKGSSQYESVYQEAKYWFATAENKALFDANPEKYAPLFGGFCAVAVTEGNLRPIQIWTHEITDGRLVVNHSAKAKKIWDRRSSKKLKKAIKNWGIVNQKEAKYDLLSSKETQESLAESSYGTKK